MTPESVQPALFAFADALMLPHPVVMLAVVLAGLWALYKWGAPLLVAFALFYIWIGRWDEAGLALAFALVLTFVRTSFHFLDRLTAPATRDGRA
jgi:ABC-type proline/glycine betaine transport system permease subunit